MEPYINDTIRVIEQRTSIRSFLPDSITEEEREIIHSAALRAPNGGKMSKFSLIDVRDQAIKKKIAHICCDQKFVAAAPGVYVILADFNRWFRLFRKYVGTYNVEINYPHEDEILLSVVDAMLAAENMVIAAESMGIGSCFIADIITRQKEVKELLGLPKYVMPVCLCVFGRAKAAPKARTPRIGTPVVFRDRYEVLPDDQLLSMIEPLVPRKNDGSLTMSEEEFVNRYYVRRLGSWVSLERTVSVRAMFEDWLKSPFDE